MPNFNRSTLKKEMQERERHSAVLHQARLEIIRPEPAMGSWPEPIGAPARIGLAGELLEAVEPITEADPNAILMQFLAAAGNLLGSGPHLAIGERRHALRLWPLVVGSTASGKKGTAAGLVFSILDDVDPAWTACRKMGIASGEAVVHHVRDDTEHVRRKRHSGGPVVETAVTLEGVADKRLLLIEEEFSRVIRLARKEGTTLSATLREAWDHDVLMTTSKTAAERATGAHVTVIGHITPEELRRELTSTEISNGFANRFLFVLSRRSKRLSLPPKLSVEARAGLVEPLRTVKAHWEGEARSGSGEIHLAERSRDIWRSLKPEIEEEAEQAEEAGLAVGKVISRGAPYVLRIAAAYAALDRSPAIEAEHLAAAREVWRYSVASARALFGDEISNPDARRVLEALADREDRTLSRWTIHDLLSRHRTTAELTRLRDGLIRSGRIEAFIAHGEEGRQTEWWRGK